jgi:hypothetical protein
MTSRKTFIKKITVAVAGIALFSHKLMAKSKDAKMIIVLDAVRKSDIQNFMPLTLRLLAKKEATIIHHLKNESNLDIHTQHIKELLKDEEYYELNLNAPILQLANTNKLLITGFDVAHYNQPKYIAYIAKADAIIADILTNCHSDFLIMTSMGRNNYENELNGLDHNHESARECWAAYISANNNVIFNAIKPITTKQLSNTFNA